MAALAHRATAARNTNVLMHILGYFKRTLDAASRHELLGVIEDYRHGLVYLNPHPKELALRNHV